MSKPRTDPQTGGPEPDPTPTDADLLRCAQAGQAGAIRAIYERYLPTVWRFVFAQVRGAVHAAEDVTAETFLAAVRGFRTLDPERTLLAGWLIGIARHKLADCRRRGSRMERALERLWENAVPEAPADGDACLEAGETRESVARVMERLADDQRLVLEYRYIEELSVRQIADRLGRTEKAVEALLYRARQAFREEWDRTPDAREEVKT